MISHSYRRYPLGDRSARKEEPGSNSTLDNTIERNRDDMNTPVRDKSIVRLALITNLVATVVVAVATRSAEAIVAVQAPLVTLLGGHALTR